MLNRRHELDDGISRLSDTSSTVAEEPTAWNTRRSIAHDVGSREFHRLALTSQSMVRPRTWQRSHGFSPRPTGYVQRR